MNYLHLKNWSNKIYSTPEIPRKNNFVESLYNSLKQFKDNNLAEKTALRLRTNGFLFKDENNNWKLTNVSKNLLRTKNNKILFKHLSNTIIFFGEILYLLNQDEMM